MRRIALVAAMFAACWSSGCATSVPLTGKGRRPADADGRPEGPIPRFARDAVPDAVMLQDQLGSGYRDSPIGP